MPQESKGLITGGIQALLVALITSFLLTLSSGYSKVQANTKDIEELKDAIYIFLVSIPFGWYIVSSGLFLYAIGITIGIIKIKIRNNKK